MQFVGDGYSAGIISEDVGMLQTIDLFIDELVNADRVKAESQFLSLAILSLRIRISVW